MSRRASAESSGSLAPDFLDFIVCLNERAVDAVLVGGYALGAHGVVRATADIDFLYRRTAKNVRRLCAALEDFGAPPNVIDFEVLMTPDMVTMFGAPPHRVDLLSDITGVSFEQVWAGSVQIVVEGQPLRVIGLEELHANKAATGRRKDARDLRSLGAAPAPSASTSSKRRSRAARSSVSKKRKAR